MYLYFRHIQCVCMRAHVCKCWSFSVDCLLHNSLRPLAEASSAVLTPPFAFSTSCSLPPPIPTHQSVHQLIYTQYLSKHTEQPKKTNLLITVALLPSSPIPLSFILSLLLSPTHKLSVWRLYPFNSIPLVLELKQIQIKTRYFI